MVHISFFSKPVFFFLSCRSSYSLPFPIRIAVCTVLFEILIAIKSSFLYLIAVAVDMQTDGLHPAPHQIHIFQSFLFPIFHIIHYPSVSVRSIFSVFHVDHARWLPGAKLSFGSLHICELCPIISSFHKSILIAIQAFFVG